MVEQDSTARAPGGSAIYTTDISAQLAAGQSASSPSAVLWDETTNTAVSLGAAAPSVTTLPGSVPAIAMTIANSLLTAGHLYTLTITYTIITGLSPSYELVIRCIH
jgi:hypothetical protein